MIRINKDEEKAVYFTLSEKATISPSYYIFEFVSNDTGNSVLMTANDFSSNTNRYNVFTFSEGSSDDLNGGFTLGEGTYDYKVWQSSTQSVVATQSNSIVLEVGLLEVSDLSNVAYSPRYTEEDNSDDFVYEP